MERAEGFTLVELLTVIALVSFLAFGLYSPLKNVYKTYQVQLAAEQAKQDLKLLELVRRGEYRSAGFIPLSDLTKEMVVADFANSSLIGSFLAGGLVENSVQTQVASYSVDTHLSSVTIQFEQFGNEEFRFPAANTQIVEVDVANPDGVGADIQVDRIEVSFNYRETDPLILNYVIDSYHMR